MSELTCEVKMDGEVSSSDDFVCILSQSDGNTSIWYNTDVLTMGIAIKLMSKAFVDMMTELDPGEHAMVLNALGEEFEVPFDTF